jgi:spore photoproduct lyase
LPCQYHKNIVKLYPEEHLFCGPLKASNGMVSYGGEREKEMMDFCTQALCQYVPERIVFPCVSVA